MPSDISVSLTSVSPLTVDVPQSGLIEVQGAGNGVDGVNVSLMSTPALKINVPQRGSIEVRNAVYGTSGGGGSGSDPDAVKIYGNQTIAGNKTFTGITAGITKSMVGLSNVDNTSDVNKPISNATQLVLDTKSSTSHTHSNATTSVAGFMSIGDKTKLDAIVGVNTGDQTITLTGDVTGTGNGSFAATLKDTGPGVGTYRSVTIDVKGRVTAGTNPTTLSGYAITDAAPLSGAIFTGNISASNLSGSNTGDETASSIKTKLDITTLSGSNTGDQTITLGGDATGEGTASLTVTLANTGVVAGEYNNGTTAITPFTVDAKGRITATDTPVTITPDWSSVANTPTTLVGYNITDAVNAGETQTITGAKEFTLSPIVPRPTESNHAVNKAYADDISAGLHVHEQVHVILTIDLETATGGTVAYTNGTDGVGAKLTVIGGSTIITALNAECGEDDDLVAGENGSRIIINGEVDNKNWNGIYIITADRELTRAADFDSSVEMAGGDFVFVTHGTTYADTGWVLSEPVTTVGSSNVEFVQFSGSGAYDAGDGLHRDGTVFSVVGTSGRIVVGPSVDLATHGVSGTYQSVTTDAYGRVTSGSNPTTLSGYGITDAATSSALSNHVSDDARHLTSTQNTLIDSITASSAEINRLSGVTSNVQTQLDGKSATSHVHADATTSVAGFMSTSDKTKLDAITGTNTGDQTITLTGDVSGSGTGSFATTLKSVGTAGTYQSVTTDSNGRVTSGTNPTTLLGYGITDAAALSGAIFTGSISATNLSGANTGDETSSTIKTKLGVTTLSGSNTGDQTITLTGDVTGSGTGSFTATLKDTGPGAGTYQSVTIDVKGRVTAGTNPTTLSGYGITDAATATGLSNHISDETKHLTSAQNTLIDGITTSSAEINRLSGVSSNVQTQLNSKSSTSHTHDNVTTSIDGFMSAADKTKLNTIASGAEVNVNADWNVVSGDAQILNKPTTLSGYGITDAAALSGATFTGQIYASYYGDNGSTITANGDIGYTIVGTSNSGTGVHGQGGSSGVSGEGIGGGYGVLGTSIDGFGGNFSSTNNTALNAGSELGVGIAAFSVDGNAIDATSINSIGLNVNSTNGTPLVATLNNSIGTIAQFYNESSGVFSVLASGSIRFASGSSTLTLAAATTNANARTITFPATSGTVALKSTTLEGYGITDAPDNANTIIGLSLFL